MLFNYLIKIKYFDKIFRNLGFLCLFLLFNGIFCHGILAGEMFYCDFSKIDNLNSVLAMGEWQFEGSDTKFQIDNEFAGIFLLNGRKYLRLKHSVEDPGIKPYKGAEVRTNQTFRYGRYKARIKAPMETGLVVGFFVFYEEPDKTNRHEIDIEIVTKLNTIVVGTFAGWDKAKGDGESSWRYKKEYSAKIDLKEFHEYGFDWHPDKILFSIDGKIAEELTINTAIPSHPGTIRLNIWAPSGGEWFGPPPIGDSYAWIDYISFVPIDLIPGPPHYLKIPH